MSALLEAREVARRVREQVGDLDRLFASDLEIQHAYTVRLALGGPGPTAHERPARPLLPRVDERLLERPADAVARHGPAPVPEAPGERQRPRLLRREVDDEEVWTRQG